MTAFVAVLGVSQPLLWLDFPNFVVQLATEVNMTGPDHWAAHANPALFYTNALARSLGWPLLVMGGTVLSLALAVGRAPARGQVLLPLAYTWFMTQRPSQFERWVLPVLPFVAVAASVGLVLFLGRLNYRMSRGGTTAHRWSRPAAAAAAALALAPAAWPALVKASRRPTTPTHVLVEKWVTENVRENERLLIVNEWLNLGHSDAEIERVEKSRLGVLLRQHKHFVASFDWIVVAEPHMEERALRHHSLAASFLPERGFGGNRGFDFAVYRVIKEVGNWSSGHVRFDDPESRRFLGPGWRPPRPDMPGRRLPSQGARIYLDAAGGRPVSFQIHFYSDEPGSVVSPIEIEASGISLETRIVRSMPPAPVHGADIDTRATALDARGERSGPQLVWWRLEALAETVDGELLELVLRPAEPERTLYVECLTMALST